jgi:hypothetical protein
MQVAKPSGRALPEAADSAAVDDKRGMVFDLLCLPAFLVIKGHATPPTEKFSPIQSISYIKLHF